MPPNESAKPSCFLNLYLWTW